MIEVRGLAKRYGATVAVEHLSFTVHPGVVTGFLGPNGAGKSTTMRLILGLDRPSEGSATICGHPYRDLGQPLRHVGALLEARSVDGARSVADHLLFLAQTQGLPRRRVGEVLAMVGLAEVARKKAKGLSLGMAQRLGVAAALLGDPEVLVLDEPVNGLDPEGVIWIRNLMRDLAREGRTVFVSSHLMNEMAVTAEHVIVIGKGKLLADCLAAELVTRASASSVRVVTPDAVRLGRLLRAEGATVTQGAPSPRAEQGAGVLLVTGLGSARVGKVAASAGVELHELVPQAASLESAFMELTAEASEFAAGGAR